MSEDGEFRKQYLQDWTISATEIRLHHLAKEYHDRCEAYDRTICSGPIGLDGVMPNGYRESGLINRNAHRIIKEILERENLPRSELIRAIQQYRRHRAEQ
jgi:hypothetical protein